MSEKKKKRETGETKIEDLLEDIQGVLEKMEKNDITLEESFNLYKEGTEKLNEANRILSAFSKEAELLDMDGNPDGTFKFEEK